MIAVVKHASLVRQCANYAAKITSAVESVFICSTHRQGIEQDQATFDCCVYDSHLKEI